MPINIPISVNQEKIQKGFKKMLYFLGAIAGIAVLIYLIYKYYSSGNANYIYLVAYIIGALGYQFWLYLKPKLKKSTVKLWRVLASVFGLLFFGYLAWTQYIIQNNLGTIIMLLIGLWFVYTLIKNLKIKTE